MSNRHPPIACNLGQLSEAQRAREQVLLAKILRSRLQTQQVAAGYALRLPADSVTLLEVAEFIMLERICCPFFDFELGWEAGEDTFWLKLTGPDGVKLFLDALQHSKKVCADEP